MLRIVIGIAAFVILMASVIPVTAETVRTTPVEVKNQVEISPNANVVQSAQEGTWNVGIAGVPDVSIVNSPTVSISGTPTVNVGTMPSVAISGTPNVNIANTPNVSIANIPTVNAPTQRSLIFPWSSNVTLASGETTSSIYFDCGGYKEIRVRMGISHTATEIKVRMYWQAGYNVVQEGQVSFSATQSLIQGGTPDPMFAFTMPTLSDRCMIQVYNGAPYSITLSGITTWVYLVN